MHVDSCLDAVVHDVAVALGLDYGHRVLLFVAADFAADAHASVQHLQQLVVDAVDFAAQHGQVFGGGVLLAQDAGAAARA